MSTAVTLEAVAPTVDQIVADKQARALDETALRAIFTEARSANGFLDRPIPADVVRRLVELAHLGPTSANSSPLRLVLVETPEAKERLRPLLAPGNVEKTMGAPLTVIVATDTRFYEQFPTLFPHRPEIADLFKNDAATAKGSATLNGALGGGYLILAARALGLDAGPIGGFDKAGVDREFLAGTGWETLFIVNLGYGDDAKLFPRLPRLTPEQVTLRV